jgi:DNA replication protein DnaC
VNLIELNRALKQLRLGGMAAVLETRLRQAQSEPLAPIDLISCLVSDELARRGERLLERRKKQAQFRDAQKSVDNFDFNFNKKMNRSLVFDLATGAFIARHEDALFLGPPGTGKSHLAQAIGQAAIQQGYRVLYRETYTLLDELADATLDGTRREHMDFLVTCRCSSSTTWECASCRSPPPKSCWRSSCGDTNAPAPCSPPTARWKTGANCWAMRPRSVPCSTACCTTGTC